MDWENSITTRFCDGVMNVLGKSESGRRASIRSTGILFKAPFPARRSQTRRTASTIITTEA